MFELALPLAGDFESFFSENIWPHRWAFGVASLIVLALVVAAGYRLRLHDWAWERRLFTGPAIAVFLIVFIPVSYLLVSPLFIRDTVCEASPVPGAGAGSERCEGMAMAATMAPTAAPFSPDSPAPTEVPVATDAPAEFDPRVVREGAFEGADDFHFGRGMALLIETAPDTYVLRFEEFSVRNGPDLFVYLSPDPAGYAEGALKLGGLKGTDGAFNYDVPPGTDVSQFQSAVIWCDAFAVLFATATFGS